MAEVKEESKTWECSLLFKVTAPTQEKAVQWARAFVETHLKGKATGLAMSDKPIEES